MCIYKVLAACWSKPKVGIKLSQLAILFQNTAPCFLSSDQSLVATPFLNSKFLIIQVYLNICVKMPYTIKCLRGKTFTVFVVFLQLRLFYH